MIVEICTGSYNDALNAYKGGAKRIELNSALHLGGLTPSLASLILTKANTNLKVICMIRPRAGGFVYSKEEFEEMKLSTKLMLEHGADGIAIGILTKDNQIDIERLREIKAIVDSFDKELVFHRAIDCTDNMNQAVQQLIDLKVTRLLTSGGEDTAIQGKDTIKELVQKYGNQIEILAGSGINRTNVKDFINYTKVKQVHSSCKAWMDETPNRFTYDEKHINQIEFVDSYLVKELLKQCE